MNRYYTFILALIAIAPFITNESAYAANASRMIGFSARDEGMAGYLVPNT